jgi:hypothetical protein
VRDIHGVAQEAFDIAKRIPTCNGSQIPRRPEKACKGCLIARYLAKPAFFPSFGSIDFAWGACIPCGLPLIAIRTWI